ncbi:MAG TPA: hypothetical protein VE033_16855 [Acetobacteraceae bacterium]|nr:hypothetical protein [Acetobacteraceae bacterium]
MSTRALPLSRVALPGAQPALRTASPDGLGPARGVMLALLLSASAWAGILLALG